MMMRHLMISLEGAARCLRAVVPGPHPARKFARGWVCRGFWYSRASDADAIGIQPVPRLGRFGTGAWRLLGAARRPAPHDTAGPRTGQLVVLQGLRAVLEGVAIAGGALDQAAAAGRQ